MSTALIASGCAGHQQADNGQVSSIIATRIDKHVEWYQGCPDDQMNCAIQCLLENARRWKLTIVKNAQKFVVAALSLVLELIVLIKLVKNRCSYAISQIPKERIWKKLILTALSSMCLITISSHVHAMDNMSGNSSQMMGMQMNMTENDVYSHPNGQDRAVYDKLDAHQRAFVVRMINRAPQMQMMHQKMMDGQGQMQQDRGMNRDMMQQDRNMYNQR